MTTPATASRMLTDATARPITDNPAPPAVPPSRLTLPADLSLAQPPGDTIRHILVGRPGPLRQTIHLLHNLRYVEVSQWSPLMEIPSGQLVIVPRPEEQMTILVRRV